MVMITNKFGEEERVGRRHAWITALKMDKKVTNSMRVCSRHFTETDFTIPQYPGLSVLKKRLKGIAVPSQNLPDKYPQKSSSGIAAKRAVARAKKNCLAAPARRSVPELRPIGEEISSICRLCATPCSDVISVFDSRGTHVELLEKIHTYLPIMMRVDDLLPTTVCCNCINKLEVCHNLVQNCLDADVQLKTIFGLKSSVQSKSGDETDVEHDKEESEFTNLTDAKFEAVPDDMAHEQQNQETVVQDDFVHTEPDVFPQIMKKQEHLINSSKEGKTRTKLKCIMSRETASTISRDKDLQEILKVALHSNLNAEIVENPKKIHFVESSRTDCRQEMFGNRELDADFELTHDHTYMRKIEEEEEEEEEEDDDDDEMNV
ncbi:hypothetical protein L9F63_005696 [Diploptera punctata]|uniref:ZAD domain-containing protein n=1 Tax=Diploptera punctata TaxID=6984 RepID=A0AAD7ZCZ7_DIPPU|nr:hypothetical protein L9F63_005696 [Diploptera punctata]